MEFCGPHGPTDSAREYLLQGILLNNFLFHELQFFVFTVLKQTHACPFSRGDYEKLRQMEIAEYKSIDIIDTLKINH